MVQVMLFEFVPSDGVKQETKKTFSPEFKQSDKMSEIIANDTRAHTH